MPGAGDGIEMCLQLGGGGLVQGSHSDCASYSVSVGHVMLRWEGVGHCESELLSYTAVQSFEMGSLLPSSGWRVEEGGRSLQRCTS
jgi:hypothetical protein